MTGEDDDDIVVEGAPLPRLPNADIAVVDVAKVRDYLLNPAHPDNGGKVRFFGDLGFSRSQPVELCESLAMMAATADVQDRIESTHGVKFVIDGIVTSRKNRSALVRTIWIIETGRDAPRLVTAYPLGAIRG